jgi:Mn2+/Fe2+ NRAMP family transporter
VEAPRFNLVLTVVLLVALIIGLLGFSPLRLALYASTIMALFLPISLSPFLVIMNDPTYVGAKTNGWAANIALVGVLLMAFVVAAVSLPLMVLSGGA